MRQHAKFRIDCLNHCGNMADFRFLQDAGRPPSWICFMCIWTTHEEYLFVFVTAQNLVRICILVSIIGPMPVLMFCDFGFKMPIQASFWVVFGAFYPLAG